MDLRTGLLVDALVGRLDERGRLLDAGIVSERNGPAPSMFEAKSVDVGGFFVEYLRAVESAEAVIVFVPGLGPTWTTGGMVEYGTMVRKYAERTSAVALFVDWHGERNSLAFAVETVVSTLDWARNHVRELSSPRVPLVVAGHGVGATIAAAAAAAASNGSDSPPDLQFLISPAIDLGASRASTSLGVAHLVPQNEDIAAFLAAFASTEALSGGMTTLLPRAGVPGLAPAIVATAELDPLMPEGEAYALALRESGALVSYRCYDGQIHGFPLFIELTHGELLTQQLVRAITRFRRLGRKGVIEERFVALETRAR